MAGSAADHVVLELYGRGQHGGLNKSVVGRGEVDIIDPYRMVAVQGGADRDPEPPAG